MKRWSKKMIRLLILFVAFTSTSQLAAKDNDIFGKKKAGQVSFIPGEYQGTYLGDKQEIKYGLQIFALGDDKFKAIGFNGGLPGAGFKKGGKIERVEGKLVSSSKSKAVVIFENGDEDATAQFDGGVLIGMEDDKVIARLKRVKRAEPVLEDD